MPSIRKPSDEEPTSDSQGEKPKPVVKNVEDKTGGDEA
jgi:hypothetical protein